jgi:sugar/nucleoside kinase (ribokinase family)
LTTLDILARPVDALPANDTTAILDQIVLVPAGTAGGTAMVAARLGVRTALASTLGADPAGRLVRAELEAAGIDASLVGESPDRPTSVTILPINSAGQRPNLHAIGAGGYVADTDALRLAAERSRFIHFAAVGASGLKTPAAAQLLAAAKAVGATVTCDLISPRKGVVEDLKQLLPHVAYFMPNAAEARMLSGRDDLADAGRFLRDLGAGACVFTDGANGAVLIDVDGATRFLAHAITPVDTTSCGDSYCAGFIAALERGWAPSEACRFAGAVSALVAQGLGTLGALASFEAAETLMRTAARPVAR